MSLSRHSTIFAGSIIVFLVGYTVGKFVMSAKIQDVPLQIVEDNRAAIPVVELLGIKDGKLEGDLLGDVRLFLGGKMIIPNGSGSFSVSADSLFINYIQVKIPDGMEFVASKRGKNYYPVSSSAGERIVPRNRLYFIDSNAAEYAGFNRGD